LVQIHRNKKLLKEKNQNSSLYQILNKGKRVDKAITNLESIKKFQEKNNNSVANSPKNNKNSFPTEIILLSVVFIMAGLGIVFWGRKGKRKTKS